MSAGSEYQIYYDAAGRWVVVYRWTVVERCRPLDEALTYVLGLPLADEWEGGDE